MMPFKMVEKAAETSLEITAWYEEHKAPLANRLASKWSTYCDKGEIAENVTTIMRLVELDLSSSLSALLKSTCAHEAEIEAQQVKINDRDEAEAELRASYLSVRDVYVAVAGKENAVAAGFARVAQGPSGLCSQVSRLIKKLEKTRAPESAGATVLQGVLLDHDRIGSALKPGRDRLRKALKAVEKANEATVKSREPRNSAFNLHCENLRQSVHCGEMFCKMAGMAEEAARLKALAGKVR